MTCSKTYFFLIVTLLWEQEGKSVLRVAGGGKVWGNKILFLFLLSKNLHKGDLWAKEGPGGRKENILLCREDESSVENKTTRTTTKHPPNQQKMPILANCPTTCVVFK